MSDVIHLSYKDPGIAIIAMVDRENRNTMTEQFRLGIKEAFDSIEANPAVKVVITHGYDNYYCCGGDQATLMELTKGVKTYADLEFFMQLVNCKLPTIAAVQGHALGAGLSFACLHDFIFLSSGSLYGANFMKYGFTPGMCSTYIIPKRFGENCGKQLLYTAKQYATEELEGLNCMLPFYSKDEVMEQALQLAIDICDKTVVSIKLLKEQLSAEMRQILPDVIQKEIAMQSKTITSEEAKRLIRARFGK